MDNKRKIIRQRGIITEYFPGREDFIRYTRKNQAKARQLFPAFTLQDEDLPIVFTQSGRVAGMAKRKGNIYNIEFNVEAILRDWDEMVNNTIPHEMAHIVDMFLHGGRSSHGPRWQSIAFALGCNPQRTHDIPLSKARRTRRYLYVASCGTRLEIGSRHHRRIRRGETFTVKKTGGAITIEHFTGKVVLK